MNQATHAKLSASLPAWPGSKLMKFRMCEPMLLQSGQEAVLEHESCRACTAEVTEFNGYTCRLRYTTHMERLRLQRRLLEQQPPGCLWFRFSKASVQYHSLVLFRFSCNSLKSARPNRCVFGGTATWRLLLVAVSCPNNTRARDLEFLQSLAARWRTHTRATPKERVLGPSSEL